MHDRTSDTLEHMLQLRAEAAFERQLRRRRWTLPALMALLFVVTLYTCTVGGVHISTSEILAMLSSALRGHEYAGATPEHAAVFFAIRLPRIVLAILIGASLGVSGAAMQGVFRNPLVDPGLLGVSGGAALGAVSAIVLGASVAGGLSPELLHYALPVAAFVGSVGAMLLVQWLGSVDGRASIATLLLAGIAVNALTGALTGLLTYKANDAQLRTITFWSFGSLGGASWPTIFATAPFFALAIIGLPRMARPLNALLLGEAEAGHLGYSTERTKRWVILLVSLAVGTAVSVAGIIGFIGLVVPHLLRLVTGPDHRILLPGSALLGGSLLLVSDAFARTLAVPAELPIGIVTACLGTPFLLALLAQERRRIA